jgi:hypothetical protein
MTRRIIRTIFILSLSALFITSLVFAIFRREHQWSVIRSIYPSDPMIEERTSLSLVIVPRSVNVRYHQKIFDWRTTDGFLPPKGYSIWHFDHSMWDLRYATLLERAGFRWDNEPHLSASGRTLEIGVPLWLVVLISGVSLAQFHRRLMHRVKDGKCQNCGYDLRGCVGGTCSECGLKYQGSPGGKE